VFHEIGPFAFIKPAKNHLTVGFWRGAELDDPERVLVGGDRMRHLKLMGPNDLDERQLVRFVKNAVTLNRQKGDPTKRGS
jgi:hypothetical protein